MDKASGICKGSAVNNRGLLFSTAPTWLLQDMVLTALDESLFFNSLNWYFCFWLSDMRNHSFWLFLRHLCLMNHVINRQPAFDLSDSPTFFLIILKPSNRQSVVSLVTKNGMMIPHFSIFSNWINRSTYPVKEMSASLPHLMLYLLSIYFIKQTGNIFYFYIWMILVQSVFW